MACERSNHQTHADNPNQRVYDEDYYRVLYPDIYGKVLDVGCGAGMFTNRYAKKDEVTEILAIDKYTDEIAQTDKIKVIKHDLTQGIPATGKFDCVVSTEFLEHVPHEASLAIITQIHQLLKKGGLFLGCTPNKIEPTYNPFHIYEYTLAEIKEVLEGLFSEVYIFDNGQNCSVWRCVK